MRVAILGAGMSGLVAAQALYYLGMFDVDIYDKCIENASQQKGLHYLHGNCGLPLEPHRLKNLVFKPVSMGVEGYVQYSIKVWGNDNVLNNSVKDLEKEVIVYDFKQGFDILKNKFSKCIYKADITRDFVKACQMNYDLIISTIPLNILFPNVICESETVYASQGLPIGLELEDCTVAYNLHMDVPWYRASRVFDCCYTEYVGQQDDSIPIKKIKTQTSLDTYEILKKHKIMLVGRFGEWNRKRLVHQIFDIVIAGIMDLKKSGVTSMSLID